MSLTEGARQIRQLGPADAAMFRDIRLEALQTAPEAFGAAYEDEAARPLARWEAGLSEADFLVIGAFVDGQLVSIGGIGLGGNVKMRHKAGIYTVYTRPAFRSRGLSLQVVQALIDRGRKAGRRSFRLGVSAPNVGARRLYERLGFVAYGCEPKALIVDGVAVDLVLMALDA